jgi:hypothetical protein
LIPKCSTVWVKLSINRNAVSATVTAGIRRPMPRQTAQTIRFRDSAAGTRMTDSVAAASTKKGAGVIHRTRSRSRIPRLDMKDCLVTKKSHSMKM